MVFVVLLCWDGEGTWDPDRKEIYGIYTDWSAAAECAEYCREERKAPWVEIEGWETREEFLLSKDSLVFVVLLCWEAEIGSSSWESIYSIFANRTAAQECAEYCRKHEPAQRVDIEPWKTSNQFDR